MGISYPTPERVIEYNLLVINFLKVKKKDKAEVLSYKRLTECIGDCRKLKGDIYDKATFLLKSMIQKHPFASGNRRTSFIVVKDFLLRNNAKFNIVDDPKYARVMLGIRENFYSDEEIKKWIIGGEINEFKR